MDFFSIYSVIVENKDGNLGVHKQNHIVLFFPFKGNLELQKNIEQQLRTYFHENILPNKIIIFCLDYNKEEIQKLFKSDSEIFNYIPKFRLLDNEGCINILSIDKKGETNQLEGKKIVRNQIDYYFRFGLTKIFKENGGLINSHEAHHFVFPSGKHCNQFLRTGNVLLKSSDIKFIATAIHRFFKEKRPKYIYCDTSSINSLAFAYVQLLKELDLDFHQSVLIESFSSYSVFDNKNFEFKRESFYLISSSTSGGIIERMTKENNGIDISCVAVIYGLKVNPSFKSSVICDLYKDKDFTYGIDGFETYNVLKGENCRYCEEGSKSLKVNGDVFLLEKPKVSPYRITINDIPKYLQNFKDYYSKPVNDYDPIVKVFHKENSSKKKYDIYIDFTKVFKSWNTGEDSFKPIIGKLENFVLQYIPSSIKYLIVLPDDGSRLLSNIIQQIVAKHGIKIKTENIIESNSKSLEKILNDEKGTIAIITSSVVSGRNLLFLSRALRKTEKNYRRIFFTFLSRTQNQDHYNFLESNLGIGEYGNSTHSIVNVEKIFCSNESLETPWHVELDFIKKIIEFKDDIVANLNNENNFKEIDKYDTPYFHQRENELNSASASKGLSNNLFFPSNQSKPLEIRNGFVFAPFSSGENHSKFIENSTQSEIYFIISSILNELRNKKKLIQSEYSKTVLDPGNFVRFNDGVIQASILRAAKIEELDYSLSNSLSEQMQAVIEEMIVHLDDEHAEALNEFLYAIAIRKLKLQASTLNECLELVENKVKPNNGQKVTFLLIKYIKEYIRNHT